MPSSIHLRGVLAVTLLCGVARSAFADGALMTHDEANTFLIVAALVIVAAIVGMIVLIRLVIGVKRWLRPRPTPPEVPEVRIVQDRSKPS